MPAKMLELECPGCNELLELDAGFAGGVCRCSTCGTLMTVPADPQRESAERLLRPDRPGGVTRRPSRPGRPAAPAGDSTPPPTETADRPQRPDKPRSTRPASPASQGEKQRPSPPAIEPDDELPVDGEADVYTTESGRVIRVERGRAIPTARKRKVARYVTYGVFGVAVGGIVAACIFAAIVLLKNPPTPPAGPGVVEAFTYDRANNPFTLDKANILGLPLRERTAVVIVADESSADWLDAVQQTVAAGLLDKPGSGSRVQVIYAAAAGPVAMSTGMETVSSLHLNDFAALHSQVTPGDGPGGLGAAVERAAGLAPTHLVLIGSDRPTDAELAAIHAALATQPNIYVDTIAINRDLVAFDDLANAHQGRYIRLSADQLARWQADAQTGDPQAAP